jgi:peptide-methionine (S)-S-oxide reductase
MRGVERVIVGYTGGKQPHPKYGNLQDHTEALLLDFNPKEVSYWEILEMWHDNANPWKRDSIQYRSAIFWTSLSQQDEALQFLQRLSASNPKKRLRVHVELARAFYKAEPYHQNYIARRQQSSPKKPCLSGVCVPVWKKREDQQN